MGMEMSLKEKVKTVVSIIDEARTIQKTNPVYVRVDYFSASNLGFPNVRDIFRTLRENKAIKSIKATWVCEEIDENGLHQIVKVGAKQSSDEDYETYEIKIDEDKFKHQLPGSNNRSATNEIEFDAQNGVIFFGRISHVFQKGRVGQLRLRLFKELWDTRRVTNGGKEKRKGELFPANALASRLGFVESSQSYIKDYEAKDKLEALLKNTERTLQHKNIPIRLYQKGGVQIVVEI